MPAHAIAAVLEAAGVERVADYGSSAPDDPDHKYRPDTHVVRLEADTADEAGRAVTEVVQDKAAGFQLISVSPDE